MSPYMWAISKMEVTDPAMPVERQACSVSGFSDRAVRGEEDALTEMEKSAMELGRSVPM